MVLENYQVSCNKPVSLEWIKEITVSRCTNECCGQLKIRGNRGIIFPNSFPEIYFMKLYPSIKQCALLSFKSGDQNCSGQFFSPFL